MSRKSYDFLTCFGVIKYLVFIFVFLSNVSPYLNHKFDAESSIQGDMNTNFDSAKTYVLKWWQSHDENSHKKCKIKKNDNLKSNLDVENLLIAVPEINSFSCKNDSKYRQFYFTGELKEDRLEGKGKLMFLNATTFRKLSKEKQKQIQKQKICFKLNDGQIGKSIVEIIGSFSNGSLQGRSKLTYLDGSYSISNFMSGKRNGYHQTFDSNGDLIDAGMYSNGFEIGYHWSKQFGHFLFQGRNIVSNHNQKTLVFPLLNNGSLGDPMVGNYYAHTGLLENVYQIDVLEVTSKKSECDLDIEYQTGSKTNISYSLRSKEKFPTIDTIDKLKMFCNIKINESVVKSPATRLSNWFLFIINQTSKQDQMTKGQEILLQMNSLKSAPNTKNSVKLISDFEYDKETKIMTARILGSEQMKVLFQYKRIRLDHNSQPHGYNGIIIVPNANQTSPRDKYLKWVPRRIVGQFHHGVLNSSVMVATNSSSFVWTKVVNGVMHGPCIIRNIKFSEDAEQLAIGYSFHTYPGIGYIGYYKDSKPFGTFWAGVVGGVEQHAFLHGNISAEDASISGDDIAYIYPDMETALIGKFKDRQMIDARETTILETNCDENGMLYVSKYSEPEPSSPRFYYDPPTNASFGGGPKGILDPYERKWLQLRTADNPKMGEGVFAKKDFKKGELLASYAGFIFGKKNGQLKIYVKNCGMNLTKSDDERRHCTKYALPLRPKDAIINIPPEHDQPGSFHPTLGQKANHHFRQHNLVFSELEHPRWGAIMGAYATKDITAGEELFANYGYEKNGAGLGVPNDHPWYWELKRQIEKEERKFRKKNIIKS